MGWVLRELDCELSFVAIGTYFRSRYVWMCKPISTFDTNDCAVPGERSRILGNDEKGG